ncbi:resuscitation-promoting factor [Xylanimonas protaetiae]|uniref:resuscitation-promoting factor n=1 Tax=Xylanimonas protaetiae TaxID=2509457 RepID=UPI001F5D0C58|nr:resuscitation-promoting factor [Xylanimonas protaetiae]
MAAVALLAGGVTGAVADARKTVSLDVDGRVVQVSTFAGSVEGLLRAQGVRLGEHDVVAPDPGARLRDGADVVVRFGRQLTLDADGQRRQVWVAALDADDALRSLAGRGDDVRLVASRSGDRLSLPLRLAADGGDVAVVADGQTRTVRDPGTGVDAVLAEAGVSVDDDDQVDVTPAGASAGASAGAQVVLAVRRVLTQDVPTVTPLPFARVERPDPGRYADLDPVVVQAGVAGSRTRVERVTTVDGVETARTLVSEQDTSAPVDEVVAVGTRARPVAPPPVRPATPATPATPDAPQAPSGDVWAALAQCESGGNPAAVSSNGLYHGLYQFTVSTWRAMGGSGLPSEASPAEQTQRAQALQARSGWGQWPACARKLGLL